MQVTAIIAAAGQGKRMERGINKVFIPLLGKPILLHTLKRFAASGFIDHIVLVVGEGDLAYTRTLLAEHPCPKIAAIVTGGAERQHSVFNALLALPAATEWVLVHDAARPLVTEDAIARTLAAAKEHGAAGVAVPVKDTIKVVKPGDFAVTTPERASLRAIQTPQAFRRELLEEAYRRAWQDGIVATDDTALVERLGHPVKLVEGAYENIKITTPQDLLIAEALAGAGGTYMRVGTGYDVHRLVPDRPLILGGVTIPYTLGLLGHSDADVLVHAIMDALLGAAGAGDIGRHFPDTDPQYKGIASLCLLARVGEILAERNFTVHNIDAVIIAEKPKLAPHIRAMEENIARTLSIKKEAVNIKATTTEGLGFAGRQEGIAAQAVVSINAL